MKTGFLFFVSDHLLVGQLCTNPKSDRSLLSCLKVTQCSTSEIGDAPLYNSCDLPIQVMTTGPLPATSKCKSGRFNAWGHSSTHRTTLLRWWSGRTPPGRPGPKSSSKSSRQSLMKLPSGLFSRLPEIWASHTQLWMHVKEDLKCRSYRRQTSQILTEKTKNPQLIKSVRPPSSPDLNPLDYFVRSYVENITNMTSHNTKASLITAVRRAPVGACGKGMLPVPDPYRGGDWGWSRLHWIDVSSTT